MNRLNKYGLNKVISYIWVRVNITNILLPIIGYTILTLILTYPVLFKMMTHIPGGTDAYQAIWYYWYAKKSLIDGFNLFFTDFLFYPVGTSVINLTLYEQLLSIPLQQLFTLSITYNILWLSSFILTGLGTYLLALYICKDKFSSFVAGLIFTFSSYHFAHGLGHVGLTTIQWIPFFVLFMLKMFDEHKLKNIGFASLFFGLTAMSSIYYLIFAILFMCLYILFETGQSQGFIKNNIKKISIFCVVSGSIIALWIYPTLNVGSELIKPLPYESIFYSADLFGYFTPSSLHPVFGEFTREIYSKFTGNIAENTTFLGFTVLILVAYTFVKIKNKLCNFWKLSFISFFVLSLGPVLHILGNYKFTEFDVAIPLPYIIIYYILPMIENLRCPCRFAVLVMLSASILSCITLSKIFENVNRNRKIIIFMFISLLILFESLVIPFPTSDADIPQFYEKIGKESEDYAIIEVPDHSRGFTMPEFLYYQTAHEKKLVSGYMPRLSSNALEFMGATPLIKLLTSITYSDRSIPSESDIINKNITEVGSSVLNYYNIRYIILHTNYMTKEQLDFTNSLLLATLKEKPEIYDEDGLIVYKVKKGPKKSFMTLNDNWYGLEHWQDTPTRWTSNNASIFVYSPEDKDSISFNVLSFYKTRNLQVYLNDKIIHKQNITPSFVEVEIPVKLKEGDNVLRFHTPDGCQRPCDIPELKSEDSRCLGLAFQNIIIT